MGSWPASGRDSTRRASATFVNPAYPARFTAPVPSSASIPTGLLLVEVLLDLPDDGVHLAGVLAASLTPRLLAVKQGARLAEDNLEATADSGIWAPQHLYAVPESRLELGLEAVKVPLVPSAAAVAHLPFQSTREARGFHMKQDASSPLWGQQGGGLHPIAQDKTQG